MNEKKKTIFCDIDGCVLKHQGNLTKIILKPCDILPGVLEKFSEWDSGGHKIILTTGRRESARELTETQLRSVGLFWDVLIMGCNRGERVVINDIKPDSDELTARAICVKRNEGLVNVNI